MILLVIKASPFWCGHEAAGGLLAVYGRVALRTYHQVEVSYLTATDVQTANLDKVTTKRRVEITFPGRRS